MQIGLHSHAFDSQASAAGISKADREFAQLPAVEVAGEWFGGLYVIVLKRQQTVGDVSERLEIIGYKDLALHDRKVNLDLVEPTGVYTRVAFGDACLRGSHEARRR